MSEFMNLAPQITVALVIVGSATALAREMRKLTASSASPEQINSLSRSVDDLAKQVSELAKRVEKTESRQDAQEFVNTVTEVLGGNTSN